jgi:uncharacterized protein (DUF983 family)
MTNLIKKGTKLYSVTHFTCPVCHEGEFFEGKSYRGVVKKNCEVCQSSYQKEPAFYQGSYYVAYALGIITIVTSIVACLVLLPAPNPNYIFVITLIVNLGLAPLLYPLSKIIWANIFYGFKGKE